MQLNETKIDLFKDLGISEDEIFRNIEIMVAGETRYLKYLRINSKTILASEDLSIKEAYFFALAVTVNEKHSLLTEAFKNKAVLNGASALELAEAFACASTLAINNVFYRFKHFIKSRNDNYQAMPAGIKMNIMMNPVIGKELFELISLTESAVNGCESCLNFHEESVKRYSSSAFRIFVAVRIASVVRGLCIALN